MELMLETQMEDRRPLLPKLLFAIAVHLASYFIHQLDFSSFYAIAGDESGSASKHKKSCLAELVWSGQGLKDALLLNNEEALASIIHGVSSTPAAMTRSEHPPMASPEEERSASTLEDHSTKSQKEVLTTNAEIVYFRNLAQCLQDKNRRLETEGLEYYGLKEQEAVVSELENRLKIKAVEAKHLFIKIETLKDENQRLKFRASESLIIMRELESARKQVEHLKRRMKLIRVQANDKIASLEKSLSVLRDAELKNRRDVEADLQDKLHRLKELEEEASELRKENSMLEQEKLELAQRLESAETSIALAVDGPQAEAVEELVRLRESNEELRKKVEQLHTDRSTDADELIYLRWLNTCLQHEHRGQRPPPGRRTANDLSKISSPKSEGKAKQLILDYTSAGSHDTQVDSSQESNGEYDEAPADDSVSRRDLKPKLLGKLKKLVLRKSSKNKVASPECTSAKRRASVSAFSIAWDHARRDSFNSVVSSSNEELLGRRHLAKAEPSADETMRKGSSWFRAAACRSPLIGEGERTLGAEQEGEAEYRRWKFFSDQPAPASHDQTLIREVARRDPGPWCGAHHNFH